MTFAVTILGSNSAVPILTRNSSAQILNHYNSLFLIDCGEGTQIQFLKYKIKFNRINHIFISHLHGDHFFGLIGLLSTYHLMGRKDRLNIYANPEIEELINFQLKVAKTELRYPLIFHPINSEKSEKIFEDNKIIIKTIPLDHKIPTSGFVFIEKQRERNIKKEFLAIEKVPIHKFKNIKAGDDYINSDGKIYKNKDITSAPPKPRSYAYCSDTKYYEKIIPHIKNVDLLYHEATFMKDKEENAIEKFHSTTVDAANIAKKANVKKLIVGHYSARYKNLNPLLDEVKEIFENSFLAEDGLTFNVEK